MIKKYKTLLLLPLFLYSVKIFSQAPLTNVEIKSPQSYAFEKYGNIPVNLYIGAIDLKIPITNIGGDGLDIAADLVYDSSGFIPHKKSDAAGMGWSLIAGGRITRNLKGTPDEYVGNNGQNGNPARQNQFGEYKNLHGYLKGVKSNTTTSNVSTYDVNNGGVGHTDGLYWWLGNYPNQYEGEPDEFSFNMMGISGKFMVGNKGDVLVESSDPNMKVDLSELALYGGALFCVPPASKITLIDGNGTKYIFGGDLSKYEISYSYSIIPSYPNEDYLAYPVISSFSLAKVIYANGKEVNFDYEAGTMFDNYWCELTNWSILGDNSKIFSMDSYSQDGGINGNMNYCLGSSNIANCVSSSNSQDTSIDTFVLLKKSVLKSIKYDDHEIKINYINTGYPIKHYPDSFDPEKAFNEWVIGNIETYHKNILTRKTQLSYDHLGGVFKRPFLNTVKNLYSDQTYSFEYSKTNDLPPYYTKGIDHWGYWNSNNSNTRLAPFDTYNAATGDYTLNNTFRDANSQNYDVALLNKVIYPTKGFSIFEYEPHLYSKRIERTSSSEFLPTLTNNGGLAGGARIKKIFSYASDGGLSSQKEYKYTSTLDGSTSSGILMNWPRYFYAITQTLNINNSSYSNTWALKTSSNIQQNSLDSYNVGYGKVFEIETNKGYLQHDFSTYETHPDLISPDAYNVRQYKGGTYTPINLHKNFNNLYGVDRSILRGKPLRQKYFSQTDLVNPIKVIDYEYNDNVEFNLNNTGDEMNYVSIQHKTDTWVQGYRKFMNFTSIKKTTTTEYFGNNQVITKYENIFDSPLHLNLSKTKLTSAENVVTQSNYQYAHEKNNQTLINANMVGIPLETEVKRAGVVISKVETKYDNTYPSELFPSSLVSYDIQNNNATVQVTYDMFLYGKLLQFTKNGVPTTIVWGYNNTKPIATIEGMTWANAYSTSQTTAISKSNLDIDEISEQTLLTALDNMRKNVLYKDTQITTYTYNPLIGVTSITPPSGIREVYIYDIANRLKEIREDNATGKILKEFKYNYKQ